MRALRATLLALAAGAATAPAATAQPPTRTNRIGMEFVLIKPGSMVVGRFQPACPTPAAAEPRREPADPRTRWTPEDYRRCAEMVKRDAMPGFTVHVGRPYYIGK